MSSSFIAYVITIDELADIGESCGIRAFMAGHDALAYETALWAGDTVVTCGSTSCIYEVLTGMQDLEAGRTH
jgi:hypothetical protein